VPARFLFSAFYPASSMLPTLLCRVALLPRLVLLLLALGAARPALATHLLGGEMTYRYLDANGPAGAPLRYQITVTIYNNTNAGAANPNTDAPVGIYDLKTGARINLVQGLNVLAGSGAVVPATGNLAGFMDITAYTISPNLNPGTLASCPATSVSQTFRLQKFTAIVNLPVSADGYYALFTRSARNVDVKNLNTANNNASLVLYSTLSPQLTPNRSPIFSDTAVAVVCQGDTTIVLNNAVDPDGDRLVYAFGTPYGSLGGTLNGVPPFVFPLSGGNSGTPVIRRGGLLGQHALRHHGGQLRHPQCQYRHRQIPSRAAHAGQQIRGGGGRERVPHR
jgi:hypothetical protein